MHQRHKRPQPGYDCLDLLAIGTTHRGTINLYLQSANLLHRSQSLMHACLQDQYTGNSAGTRTACTTASVPITIVQRKSIFTLVKGTNFELQDPH